MNQNTQLYLTKLLEDSGAYISSNEVLPLIAGVIAAPGSEGGNGPTNTWMTMVAEKPSKALIECLEGLIATARQSEETG